MCHRPRLLYDFSLHSQGSARCLAKQAALEQQVISLSNANAALEQKVATLTNQMRRLLANTLSPLRAAPPGALNHQKFIRFLLIQLGDEGNQFFWTAPEVCSWLESIEMDRYCKPFAVDNESLRQLEVSLEADQITFLDKMRALFGRGACFRFAYVRESSWQSVG
jgi:hypothetical protein